MTTLVEFRVSSENHCCCLRERIWGRLSRETSGTAKEEMMRGYGVMECVHAGCCREHSGVKSSACGTAILGDYC
jgi:hypothetical protein